MFAAEIYSNMLKSPVQSAFSRYFLGFFTPFSVLPFPRSPGPRGHLATQDGRHLLGRRHGLTREGFGLLGRFLGSQGVGGAKAWELGSGGFFQLRLLIPFMLCISRYS